ncbi:hypothetical protein KAR48_12970 [bacterium]|nr:hypothetical protein [bacterium]
MIFCTNHLVDKGVVVDDRLQTSHEAIFAAGDIAEHNGYLYGSWHAAQFQGTIAGLNSIGKDVKFGGIPRSNTLKVLGLDMVSIGQFMAEDGSFMTISNKDENAYFSFTFHDGYLVGSIMLGDTEISGKVKKAIESKANFQELVSGGVNTKEVIDFIKKISLGNSPIKPYNITATFLPGVDLFK